MSSKMPNKMLIDATHPEETRVVVVRGNRVEEFDFETAQRKQLRGNIYLAKVTRVEPSLQAAFIEYGGNRHGFLAFSEIHPDYYRIPVSDRPAGEAEPPAGGYTPENGGEETGVPLAEALPEPGPVPASAASDDEPPGDKGGADEPEWAAEFTVDETGRSLADQPEADRVEAAPIESAPIVAELHPGDSGESGEAADRAEELREWADYPAAPGDRSAHEPENMALRAA